MIKDGDGSTLLGKTCGSTVPGPVRSKGNHVKVIFHSDYSVAKQGFQIEWTTEPKPDPCLGGVISHFYFLFSGDWKGWSNWSSCSEPCGWGTRTRERECSNQNQPEKCQGNSTQVDDCKTGSCPSKQDY